ncbi:hypothetical protein DFH09DRAFT_1467842 [Mycena vulgaris]|nr:hypothetical protein DFH09DRAFT_1467842 [Mycena vulgaris]
MTTGSSRTAERKTKAVTPIATNWKQEASKEASKEAEGRREGGDREGRECTAHTGIQSMPRHRTRERALVNANAGIVAHAHRCRRPPGTGSSPAARQAYLATELRAAQAARERGDGRERARRRASASWRSASRARGRSGLSSGACAEERGGMACGVERGASAGGRVAELYRASLRGAVATTGGGGGWGGGGFSGQGRGWGWATMGGPAVASRPRAQLTKSLRTKKREKGPRTTAMETPTMSPTGGEADGARL